MTPLIDQMLADHLQNAPQDSSNDQSKPQVIAHIVNCNVQSKKDQFLCLSSISNFHLLQYPDGSGRLIDPQGNIGYNQHILHNPGKHNIPTSPRNRLMYYITMDSSSAPPLLVKRYLSIDKKEHHGEMQIDEVEYQPIVRRKKRKHQKRIVQITLKDLSQDCGEDLNSILNSAQQNRNLYDRFKEQLVLEGVIKWRHHDSKKDVCIITDYNPTNGNLVPGSFVHVTREFDFQKNPIISCTCDIYKHLIGVAYNQNQSQDNEQLFPDTSITCMHCRYFSEELEEAYNILQKHNTNLPWALKQVQDSLQFINSPIQLTGNVIERGTTKFSVKGEDDSVEFVHITFQQGKCYAKCLGGICSVELQARKKLPRLHPITSTPNLCLHMQQILQDIDNIKEYFPWHFNASDINVSKEPEEQINTDDTGLNPPQATFNIQTGLWQYPAVTDHKPKEMFNADLVKHTELRNKFATSGEIDQESGLRIYHLKPKATDENGVARICECGGTFQSESGYKEVMRTILYTRIAPLKCICYNLTCTNKKCEITYKHPAEERGLFFYTTKTVVADEIGWDFVRSVKNMRTSFRGFCSEMTDRYQSNQSPGYPFMSGNTFVGYFFAWLAAFKIDFRKEIDPKCGYNPKILACDGTHIGVSGKNMNLEEPVTKPEVDVTLKSMHRRAQHALIPNADARSYLKYMCKKYLKKLKEGEGKSPQLEYYMKNFIMDHVNKMHQPALTEAIHFFLDNQRSPQILVPMAKVIIMLSGDSPMLSVLPFRSHDCLRRIINSIVTTNTLGPHFDEMKKYSREITSLLTAAMEQNSVPIVVSFLIHLVNRIEHLHNSKNRPTPPVDEIPNSYDPRKGVAYYFTESDNQLRRMPGYEEVGGSRNYDDPPEVDPGCTKNYPGISYGGFGYLFLWFCPIHGHSYGFHLIAGGEGRKDPFSSLFKYKPDAPEELFYDNACQLHEYCLNREPRFFMHTRFWHDLFHSIGHVCGCNYNRGEYLDWNT